MATNVITVRNSTSSYNTIEVYYKSLSYSYYHVNLVPGGGAQITVETGDIIVVSVPDGAGRPISSSELYASVSNGLYDVTPRRYFPGYGYSSFPVLIIKANQAGDVTITNQVY